MRSLVLSTLHTAITLVVALIIQATAGAAEVAGIDTTKTLGPGISVNIKKREVYMDATICLRRGILEYLICKARTFEHESIFSTDCKPSQLHMALLLVGFEPYPYSADVEWTASVREHKSSQLAVDIEFEQDGTTQRRRISELLVNRERKDGLTPDNWVFTGSVFYQRDGIELYAADSTGAVIGVTPKGASVVQIGVRLGVPYQGEEQGLESNERKVPAVGTKVRVIFSAPDEQPRQSGQAIREERLPVKDKP